MALIAYSMPASTISLVAGAGAAWLTSDAGSACIDGKPGRRSRLSWLSAGAPSTADYINLRLDFGGTTFPIRVVGVLGLKNVPVGTQLLLYGQRAGDAGVTYGFGSGASGTVVQFADGSCGAWFVLPADASPVKKLDVRILNDNAGATWATAATTIDVGEIVAMPAVEVLIDKSWSEIRTDPSQVLATRGAQLDTVKAASFRELSCVFSPNPSGEAPVRFGGLANGMDWEKLAAAFAGGARCVAIPRWATPDRVNATALYGIASEIGETMHLGGQFYSKAMKFREVPAS